MAIDEAIMEACARGEVPPTLRFYGWKPHAVSLGYFQHGDKSVDFAACSRRGIDVVRRLTGGRAVLHAEELTYSIILKEDYPELPLTITASYRYLSRGLLLGLAHLGAEAAMTKPAAAYGHRKSVEQSPACFDAPVNYELTVDSKKLIGSAQVRRQGVVLQHGSILLRFSAQDLAAVLNTEQTGEEELRAMLAARVMSLEAALQREVSWDETRLAMTEGLREALQAEFIESTLTEREITEAAALARDKYSNDVWTKKR